MTYARTALAFVAWSTLASGVFAETSSEDVVVAPIAKRSMPGQSAKSKRDTESIALKNDVLNLQYTMNVTLGTPPQPITLQIDTGSTDLWVLTPLACQTALHDPNTQGNLTQCGGPYDITSSTSSRPYPGGQGQFHATYQDGTGVQQGDYIYDTLSIGKWTIPNYIFGQATLADTVPGLIGVGFDVLEANVSQPGSSNNDMGSTSGNDNSYDNSAPQPYPAVLSSLRNTGHIKVRSFSLWLDDLDESTGTIMFGGFDTAKIAGGKLQMLPMQNDSDSGVIDRYQVALTSIGITAGPNGGSLQSTVVTPNRFVTAATLDSGTTLTEVPQKVVDMVVGAMGAQYDQVASGYVVDCSMALIPGSVDFQFGGSTGPVVGVPFSELVLPLSDPMSGEDIKGKNGRGLCQLGLLPVGDDKMAQEGLVLGDTFLRSAYVYYNLDSLSIGVAQTVFDTTQSSIEEVSSNSSLPQGATPIGTTVMVPQPTATPTLPSTSSTPAGTATGVTAKPGTTFNAGAISGQATSYAASLPTAAGSPGPRVSGEVKGTPFLGDTVGSASSLGGVGVTWTLVTVVAAVIAGMLL